MSIQKVNLTEKFALFSETWRPKIAGEVNEFHVKLAKLQGEFVWHQHDYEDELFLVVKGRLTIQLRDQDDIMLEEGELVIIPKGIEHKPVAEDEAHVLLFERGSTVNTGNADGERTVHELDRL